MALNKSTGVSPKLYRKNRLIFLRNHISKLTNSSRRSFLDAHRQSEYYSSGSSCNVRSCSTKKCMVLSKIPWLFESNELNISRSCCTSSAEIPYNKNHPERGGFYYVSYYNRFTVRGTAASRVCFRIVAKAVRMGGHWPDFRLQGQARPKESPSASLSFAAFDLCR